MSVKWKIVAALPFVTILGGCLDDGKVASAAGRLAERSVREALRSNGTNEPPSVDAAHGAQTLVEGKSATGHRNFAKAKQILPKVYVGMEEDIYCGCPYVGKEMDLAACGVQPRRNAARAARLEWEHVVPAWVLGHQRQCWQNGGRKNCSETDSTFQVAEGDLVNLVPSVGEINGDRSNFSYSAWTRNPEPMYGQCRTVIDFKMRKAQPREEVRGRLARITFYMHETYGLHMSKQDQQLFCAWAKTYPVDDWERERNRRIVRWQGSGNGFVDDPGRLVAWC